MKLAAAAMQWRQWGRAALDLVYPRRCPACLAPLPAAFQHGEFCAGCQGQFRPIEAPFCQSCCEPFPGMIAGDFTCPNCQGRPQAFDFAVSGWLSRGPVREVIHRLKYDGVPAMRLPLARLMLTALQDPRLANSSWLLVPVPLHPRKFREREFNQSAELTRTLAKATGLPWCHALRRIRYTNSQAGLDRDDRLKNLRGAFRVRRLATRRLRDRDVLLIDDVLTTGATAHECALTLKQGGARRVAVLTVARG